MGRIEIFQIDAFTDKMFHGNPAAICLMDEWLNDELLQAIALENNLSETAFVIEEKNGFQIRWFTPKGEVNLCGHAALAAGFLIFELGKGIADTAQFTSLSGPFSIRKKQDRLTMDFPRFPLHQITPPGFLPTVVNKSCVEMYESELDYLVLLSDESEVLTAQVDLKALQKLPKRGLILTAESHDFDFYSRCFYPKYTISEDPVTGSAYCMLAPFWSLRLNKRNLHAKQGLLRTGDVFCEVFDDHVLISGYCKWYSRGYLVI
ncbi:MAG: PhzF family phenazine biosynthesis protein [Legionellaceae bacterium]|nr:PhzF family phenazine biosynthesis protein [Legionellaceae bacterium]